ncbi:four helix bundle protein [Marinifilum fragile]|uniref:four helix bundle protein n=1 Tax=Marinifilum fragile TaxID=570161 RepID=UPI002AA801AF|nr:four helix bundle protein [Marinifilum fragile]
MATIKQFEDLLIWKDARSLVRMVYDYCNQIKDKGFTNQMQRAAISIMNNIAEGFERSSDKEFYRFLDIAKASCGEVRSMSYLAFDLNYMSLDQSRELESKSRLLSGSIYNMMKYLK